MGALHTALSLPPTKGCLAFLDPHVFDLARGHVTSPFRGREGRLEEADLGFHVLQIVDTRLYVVSFPVEKTKSVVGIWQHPGFGVGTRLAEVLLKKLSEGEGVKVLEFEEGKVPEATGVEETNDHQRLKERIVGFLDGRHGVTERDVFLAPTGMASIYEVLRALLKMRPGGKVVALGSIFHSTWHIFEESAYLGSGGYKHFADVTSPKFLGEVEEWLKGEQKEGREVALALLEFPSNPILESADLSGLRELVRPLFPSPLHRCLLAPLPLELYSIFPVSKMAASCVLCSKTNQPPRPPNTTSPLSLTTLSALSAILTSFPSPTSSSPH